MVISAMDIAALGVLVWLIGYYTEGTHGYLGRWMPAWISEKNRLFPFLLLLLFFSVKNYAGFVSNRAQCRFMSRVASRISEDKLETYLHGDFSRYVAVDSAVHIRGISYNPTEFCRHILNGLQQIISQSVLILLAVTGILLYRLDLFILLFVVLLPPGILIFYLLRKKSFAASIRAKQTSERSLQYLQEALSGFVESNLYHKASYFLKRYTTQQFAFNRAISDYLAVQEVPGRVMELFALLGLVMLIVFAHWSSGQDHQVIVTVGAFMAATYKIIPGVVKILNVSGQINAYRFTLDAGELPRGLPRRGPVTPVPEGLRSVQIMEMEFGYQGNRLLEGLNLFLEPGDFAGITGPSGRGKTTILNLLLGFLEPAAGEIRINGRRTSVLERQAYRRHISYVKQQPFIIRGSLLQNILLDESSYDKKRLQQALEVTGLREAFGVSPEGLAKVIVENGRNISGGQRQRIALARALYKDAPLVMLDEPFSELDEGSEYQLLQHLRYLGEKGRMILLINHRSESISICNKTMSLHD